MAMAEQRNDKPGKAQTPQQQRRGWLSRIAPGVRGAFSKRDTPENLWVKCPETGEMIFRSDLEAAHWVTPSGFHMRIGPEKRFKATFDGGKWEAIASPTTPDDPLSFPDDKPYSDKLKAARKATGANDAMSIAAGRIGGAEAVVAVQDFAFMGGSFSPAVGEAFIRAAEAAVERKAPLVVFIASGGARMQEGSLSLMQMARATLAVQLLREARLPYLVVLTDPTYGGVTASYAMLGDITLAEPKADIGFSGRRVIAQTIRETLPAGFQKSEFLLERGMIDQIVTRGELPATIASVLKTLTMGRDRRHAA
ncbi:MAG: acetyl-CoA carboxylase carboxyltransferase subunit beta [Caulobacteraceae bacterium]|nr:acetyl-CoA carboxylase carboxyltransferase subunit beta [Caulobacteraceae bacterium]